MKAKESAADGGEFTGRASAAAKRFSDTWFAGRDGVECVFLTGSVARGDCRDAGRGHWIDVCVVHQGLDLEACLEEIATFREGRFLIVEFEGLPFAVEPMETPQLVPYAPGMGSKYFALQESVLLYDRAGTGRAIQAMRMPEEERARRILSDFHTAVYLCNNYRLAKWAALDDLPQCHLNLNQALDLVFRLLFLVNRAFVPRDDYLLYLSRSLGWRPAGFEERVAEAVRSDGATLDDLLRRRRALAGLVADLKGRIDAEGLCRLEDKSHYPKAAMDFGDEDLTAASR